MNKRKYLVYKITNLLNNKIYIGCHSTLNENDRYMGSGTEIKEEIKKWGRKSFKKEILFVFDTKEEMFSKEKEIVTKEFCMNEDTYNIVKGGGNKNNHGMVTVRNQNGECMLVYTDDPRYISGELIHIRKGKKLSKKHSDSIKKANTGIKRSDEFKKNLSDQLSERHKSGKQIYHKRTDEQKKAFSEQRLSDVKEGKDKRCKKVEQYDLDDNLIKIWDSIGEAERAGFNKSSIICVCNGYRNRTQTSGFKWKYQQNNI